MWKVLCYKSVNENKLLAPPLPCDPGFRPFGTVWRGIIFWWKNSLFCWTEVDPPSPRGKFDLNDKYFVDPFP